MAAPPHPLPPLPGSSSHPLPPLPGSSSRPLPPIPSSSRTLPSILSSSHPLPPLPFGSRRSIRWRATVEGGEEGGAASLPSATTQQDVSDDFAYIRRSVTDQFAQWRQGIYEWDEAKRQVEIAAIVHPKPGGWDPWDLTDPAADQRLDQLRASRAAIRAANPDLDNHPLLNDPALRTGRVAAVQAARNVLDARFGPASFRRVRPLSTGGESLIFLYTMEDQQSRTHNVVVKVDPQLGSATTTNEIRVMKRLGGKRHLTQRLLLQAMPDPVRERRTLGTTARSIGARVSRFLQSPSRRIRESARIASRLGAPLTSAEVRRVRQARRDFDALDNVLVMEYVPNGTLESWLQKFNEMSPAQKRYGERPPGPVLWSIFFCLINGCHGMAHASPRADALHPASIQVPQTTEIGPDQRGEIDNVRDDLVHFQLNVSNVYVDKFDDAGVLPAMHQHFPLVKISNFRLGMFPMQQIERRQESQVDPYLWSLRWRGEPACFLPEQTSEAWDFYPGYRNDYHEGYAYQTTGGQRPAIVGNFGSASNVFHMGCIMWQLITGYKFEVPFVPRPYAENLLRRDISGWTFGHALLEERREWDPDNRIPRELLVTVAQCMDYMPRRRPLLSRLNAILETYHFAVWDDAVLGTREAMTAWSRRFFETPSTPTSTLFGRG